MEDLIDGLVKLMNSADDFTGPLNLGNPLEFKVLELAHKVIELTGSKSKIVFSPLPQDDPVQRKPDISLARSSLNWNPNILLDEGLKKTIDYFKSFLSKS